MNLNGYGKTKKILSTMYIVMPAVKFCANIESAAANKVASLTH